MIRRKKSSFLWILIPVLLAGGLLVIGAHYLIDPDLYRNALQRSLTLQLGKQVRIGKARVTVWGGIGVALDDLRLSEPSEAWDLL